MSVMVKVFLLLAAVVCLAKAQPNLTTESCLCGRVRSGLGRSDSIKDIQIYPATIFCRKVEIVVTSSRGRFCLDPNANAVKNLLLRILKKNRSATTVSPSPTSFTSTSNI